MSNYYNPNKKIIINKNGTKKVKFDVKFIIGKHQFLNLHWRYVISKV
jgi:hypothetical protein